MNRNAIRTYAVWARTELMTAVVQKAFEYGITEDAAADPDTDIVNSRLLTEKEKEQRRALLSQIHDKGFLQVMDEAAYTWFNRLTALRFMEVNGYLPSGVRLFSNEAGEFKPAVLREAMTVQIDGLDRERVSALLDAQNREELYKYLIITQCNALNRGLPVMFETIAGYAELLFPDNLLKSDSVIGRMIADIPEADWIDEVEIIGWLYQYYISEKHAEVVDALHGTSIKKEDIPAATQIWTPNWVVRYMVDNSLGRYWIERHPESRLADKLDYLIVPKEGFPFIKEQVSPLDLTFFDPCVGSGHILTYAFDLVMAIYEECGYSAHDAAKSILENNLYGLDIDDRAGQLAYFAVMMKARKYDRRLLDKGTACHVAALEESSSLDSIVLGSGDWENTEQEQTVRYLVEIFQHAKETGSLQSVEQRDYASLYQHLTSRDIREHSAAWKPDTLPVLQKLARQADILSRKYAVVCTNPPYMNRFEGRLRQFITSAYKSYAGDLFSVFMYRNLAFCEENGYCGFMTPNVWMFIKTYKPLREFILREKSILTLVQMAKGAFFKEAMVDICAFVLANRPSSQKGLYIRLEAFKGDMELQGEKYLDAIHQMDCAYIYEKSPADFFKIPESPLAYWVSENFINAYQSIKLSDIGFARSGLQTGDNGRFLRYWQEVDYNAIAFHMESKKMYLASHKKWTPQIKGGDYRKWYGNFDYVVNWEDDGQEIRAGSGCRLNAMANDDLFFREGITWSHTTSGLFGARFLPAGSLFNVEAPTYFTQPSLRLYILGLLNSCVAQHYLSAINATIHYLVGNIQSLPLVTDAVDAAKMAQIEQLVQQNIDLSRADWDSFETSWDFERHPLLPEKEKGSAAILIADRYASCVQTYNRRFLQMKNNEEVLNRLFIGIYHLTEELNPEVEDRAVTVHTLFDTKETAPESLQNSGYVLTRRDMVVSLISYAVGCLFGRYAPDQPGIVYAGGEWDDSLYQLLPPVKDNIIPIHDDDYSEHDMLGQFVEFIRKVYGVETLEENLRFIAGALGGKGTPREVIRSYFLNGFYADHVKLYQKRPIYWLFDSGRKNGFKALIYLQRYQPDLLACMRTNYVHVQQERYRTQLHTAQTSQRAQHSRQIEKIRTQSRELMDYEEKLHHLADRMICLNLDDGVKRNYAKLNEILAKIQ